MNLLVSVIITNHNKYPYLIDCVSSVLDQTYKFLEIIVVNDNTTDASNQYLSKLTDCRIRIFNVNFSNAAKSRNFGFDNSKGDFIQYLDADDFISPNKIELQLNSLSMKQNCLSVCKTRAVSKNGSDLGDVCSDLLAERNLVNFICRLYSNTGNVMVQPNAWFFSRSLNLRAGRWNEELTLDDDGEFFCRVILSTDLIIFVDEYLNYYRRFETKRKNISSIKNHGSIQSAYSSYSLKLNHIHNSKRFTIIQESQIAGSLFSYLAFEAFGVNCSIYKIAIDRTKLLEIWHEPYVEGFSSKLSKVIGWRCVKLIKMWI
jgi:glycosyltransferase involved in cell wall biosynthesis